jgi:hypothetical protein
LLFLALSFLGHFWNEQSSSCLAVFVIFSALELHQATAAVGICQDVIRLSGDAFGNRPR